LNAGLGRLQLARRLPDLSAEQARIDLRQEIALFDLVLKSA
jgi:hypothetical protein